MQSEGGQCYKAQNRPWVCSRDSSQTSSAGAASGALFAVCVTGRKTLLSKEGFYLCGRAGFSNLLCGLQQSYGMRSELKALSFNARHARQ